MDRKAISGIMLTLLLIVVSTSAFNIKPAEASETVYIRANGSVDPSTAPLSSLDNLTYYITGNINDPIVVERDGIVVDGNGYTLQGTGEEFYYAGILLSGTKNVTIKNTEIKTFYCGIWLVGSSGNWIFENTIINNDNGILLHDSSNNNISRNNLTVNNDNGILLEDSSSNWFSKNIIINNDNGILFLGSPSNRISESTITDNEVGIFLWHSSSNDIQGNNIANNSYSVRVEFSSNNKFYHNNFMENTQQVSTSPGYASLWDEGYPFGGNYWSNYNGTDLYSGVYQNETCYDWIGDTPYIINENNRDNYPLRDTYVPERQETRVAYRNLLSNFNSLNSIYNNLLTFYNNLQAAYDELQLGQEAISNEFGTLRNLIYMFTTTTIILIAITVYLVIGKPKRKP